MRQVWGRPWAGLGTSYIPPVKQFFYAYHFGWLQMSLIFGNTSALVLCTWLRRILLPENEPAPDRYDYPASPCAQRQGLPIIPYPSLGLGKRPGIVPLEVLSLDAPARALSPKTVSHLSGLDMSGVKELLSLHQRPGDHQHLGGDLDPHLRADAFLALAALQQAVVVRPEMAR